MAYNVRILHCNYGKTDNKHLRCTTSSVLGLFVQLKALKKVTHQPLRAWSLRFEVFEGQPFELAV
jgi:hypothetical protein